MWLVHMPKARLRPSTGKTHMRFAQLHGGKGQGKASLDVQGRMGHTAPAPRVAAQLEKRDKDRKRFNQTT